MKFLFFFLNILLTYSAFPQLDKETEYQINQLVETFKQKDYGRVVYFADELLKKKPDDYYSLVYKGQALYHLGKNEAAIQAITEGIKINPQYFEAYECRGLIYSFMEEYNLAIKDIQVAIKNDPRNVMLLNLRGKIFQKKGEFDNAIKSYGHTLSVDSSNHEALVSRAYSNKALENYSKALEDLEKAITIDATNVLQYEVRAFTYIGMEAYEKAITNFEKIIRLISKVDGKEHEDWLAYTYNNIGFAQSKIGKNTLALKYINQSIDMLDTNPYAYKNRALVYLNLNEKAKACNDLVRSKQLGFTKLYGNEVNELIKKNCVN
ncbi:tetratricopeptide repeat protein [Aureispira anguillae]|uniref:Tetratricopeptide repeat protein n=1 Tax=Aureispira anguillae TaxID=2864201 RepID=A0A915YCY6_9BACT|nr:tetratricopeptide repeat protein [Aureispira anguillae]BDS10802.1 tetratricopeptide repeat protein [Aureispira anguillae]